MGFMDKAKFWKKGDEGLDDLSDLGDFGVDNKPGGLPDPGMDSPTGLGSGSMESLGDDPLGGGVPIHSEEVQPTQLSKDMGDHLGLTPLTQQTAPEQPTMPPMHPTGMKAQMPTAPQQQFQQPQAMQPQPQPVQQSFQQGAGLNDISKELEIIHAKLDSIKSSIDTVNQRLATLERIASPDTKNKYSW